jgi:general stress protein YciG
MAGKGGRGFARMDPEKQREIARAGGRAAHASGHAHEWDSTQAAIAGRKGGLAAHHHKNAAFHHETAAHHHRKAAHHSETGDHDEAGLHAVEADGHGETAREHTEEARRHGNEPEEMMDDRESGELPRERAEAAEAAEGEEPAYPETRTATYGEGRGHGDIGENATPPRARPPRYSNGH